MTVRRCWCATTSTYSPRRSRAPVPSPLRTTTTACTVPIDVTDSFDMPVLLAALGPAMLRIAGERAGGTILWMADERAIGDYVVPRLTKAANDAGRTGIRVVAGVPVALCCDSEVDDARAYASEVLGHADFSPNYVRLLEHGDAQDVGDTMAAGDESTVLARLRRYRDAGVTDLAARVVPLGTGRARTQRVAASTQEFVALSCLFPEFALRGHQAPIERDAERTSAHDVQKSRLDTPHLELNFHSDDIRQDADECFSRMAPHHDVVQFLHGSTSRSSSQPRTVDVGASRAVS